MLSHLADLEWPAFLHIFVFGVAVQKDCVVPQFLKEGVPLSRAQQGFCKLSQSALRVETESEIGREP